MRYWKCFQWKVWVTSAKNGNQSIPYAHTMFIELHKEFQKSIISREPRFTRTVLCFELQGNISRYVLDFLAEEVRRVEATGTNKSKCRCLLMLTMGLVCATSLFKSVREGKSISLTYIHCHLEEVVIWRSWFDMSIFFVDSSCW
jgi:hypothetical protein